MMCLEDDEQDIGVLLAWFERTTRHAERASTPPDVRAELTARAERLHARLRAHSTHEEL